MTRKNYNAIATKFGMAIREGICQDSDAYFATTYGAWLMVDAFIEVAREDNPAFDSDRFREWVQKVVDTTPTEVPEASV